MNPYWIKAEGVRLGIMARPRGHDWLADDIRLLKTAGVNIIVSALTTPETEELGLEQEAPCCRDEGILFLAFPIEDRSVPTSPHDFNALVEIVNEHLASGKTVAVHCRAGIGRSSLIAACLLLRNGVSVDSAFRAIETSRGCPVPDTPEQRRWVENFSAEMRK
jgi:protein-tyrosine phosphatase